MAIVGQQLLEPEEGWRRYDDRDSLLRYFGTWKTITGSTHYNSTLLYADGSSGDLNYIYFSFEGKALRVIGLQQNTDSTLVDNNIVIEINGSIFSFTALRGNYVVSQCLLFETDILPYGVHSVKIYPKTIGKRFFIDAIDIYGDINKKFIFSPIGYQKWDSAWQTISTSAPTKQDFETYGMDDVSIIPESAWVELAQSSPTVEIVSYVPTGNNPTSFQSIYTELVRNVEMNALPLGQTVIPVSDIKTYGLQSITANIVENSQLQKGIIRFTLSFDEGSTWKSHNGTDWIPININDKNDFLTNGLTKESINSLAASDFGSQVNNGNIRVAYYLEEHIRDTDIAQVESLQTDNLTPTETTEISDMALYILNTESTINVTFEGNTVQGQITDEDAGRVQYRVILNGAPYYPNDGSFTQLQPSPINIEFKLRNNEIVVGQNNTLRIEFKDYWGNTDYWEANFIGTYAGIMFSDPSGDYYTTDLGELLKYLDFGIMIAGQTSLQNEITLTNKYGYTVQNLNVKALNTMIGNGIKLELSKTDTPFVAEDTLTYDQLINHEEMVKFYVRLGTQITATPASGAVLEIRANADEA
ncbi:hypothetical protein M6D81_15425 [Paenibacillus sp. J5C_2022]|uniref:hypothetical protein n=1 Tax=Paenibacillus sp. J5C2022 TaxID=2977129 RepID=UPI0021CF9175|nr:hypothetical protein [Paenibacillus sp. J5C2022]MCU6710087.1 hypothetical protein [Paenibacillus sp. J5C2022]